MKFKIVVLLLILAVGAVATSFQLTPGTKGKTAGETNLFKVPVNFPKPVFNIVVTQNGFKLGKVLFNDTRLSIDNTVSCANCHQQSAAFGNLNSETSTGIKNCKGKRNAPPLFNLAWEKEFMWDGRINDMVVVPLNAFTNPCEMGNTITTIVERLQHDTTYVSMFKKTFGEPVINQERVLKALGQFTVMLISANSKYDKITRNEPGVVFTADEQMGYALFQKNCTNCHKEPLFSDGSYRSNGLDMNYADIGRDSTTHNKGDLGKFRVPTLRNIEITGPYMHDGRFRTLKQVLHHYTTDMQHSPNLDPLFQKGDKPGIRLSDTEQAQVIAFLKTLTDIDFINDRRFNNN